MTNYDYLIIGGGIAGITAAETIREEEPLSAIGIVSGEPHLIYSRVLLPAYLKRMVPREKLFLRTIDDFTQKRIDLRLKEEAAFIDVGRKEVGLTNRAVLRYKKLLLAAGGKVKKWDKEGGQNFIYRLQTIDDADRLLAALETIKRPLVAGASFISLEFLEIFSANGAAPAVILQSCRFLEDILDPAGAELLENNLRKYGIEIYVNDSVESVSGKEGALTAHTASLKEIQCDALALGIGIDRNIEFLRGSGIELGEQGVRVNEFLETNYEGVFAAGDIAEFYDVIFAKHRILGNWTNAFLQGRRAGLNMVGQRGPFRNVSAYSITNLGFQITALGEYGGDLPAIVRLDRMRNQYERFLIKDGVLVCAALINRFQDKPHLAKLIEQKINVEPYQDKLQDFEFDIANIPLL